MPDLLANLLHHRVVQNSVVLFGAQISRYLLPLATVPYIARVLGPVEWGQLALMQSVTLYLLLFMDFGFSLSTSRKIALHRDDLAFVRDVISNILGAKIVLAACCLLVVGIAQIMIPALSEMNVALLLWIAVAWAVAQAFQPGWFFLGIERLAVMTALDVLCKTAATILIFALVEQRGDAWIVLASYAIASLLVTSVTLWMMYRHVPFTVGPPRAAITALGSGWNMFLYRASVNLYTSSSMLVLSLVAPAATVGFYGGADRISKAAIGLMEPANQAIFPRASRLPINSHLESSRFIQRALLGFGAAGLAVGLVLFAAAPQIVLLAFGSEFEATVPILRVLSLLLPILGLSIPLGYCWMMPFGREAALARISIVAGLTFLPLAFALGMRYEGIGIAWALVLTESAILITMGWLYRSRHLRNTDTSNVSVPAITVIQGAADGT